VRKDIQSLRGIAVMLVLLYHAQLGVVGRGFLGVDVFFVISGYLITELITKELDAGTFSFRQFYWRRAKRLLPAAYVVIALTSVGALVLLTRLELAAFVKQVIGSVSFTANIVLWKQSGYFDGTAELKPLLHMWSLSLEEQFYLVFPLALWVTPPPLRRWLAGAALVLSLGLCFVAVSWKPTAAFYLLPTRAWELMIGACGALWFRDAPATPRATARLVGPPALLSVLVVSSLAIDAVHPRWDALIVCAATLTAIWARVGVLERGPLAATLGWFGDISYSLYLVHWPIFAFARNVFVGEVPTGVKWLGVAASVVLAALLFRTVEDPIRRSDREPSRALLASVVGASLALVLIPLAAPSLVRSVKDWSAIRRTNFGLSPSCDFGAAFEPTPACRTADNPAVVVWGDSFAMHLVPGLVATDRRLGVVQATRSMCGPVLDLAPDSYGSAWANDCLAFNQSVMDRIAGDPHLRYVVLASPFTSYAAMPREPVVAKFARTIQSVREAGKKVVLVAPPPSTGTDFSLCLERLDSGLPTFGRPAATQCSFDALAYRAKQEPVIHLLEQIARSADVPVVWLSELLCSGERCRAQEDDVPLYRDSAHLSIEGSVLLARKYHLMDQLVAQAR
jgi:peptidoglycan/LPS O-acetylase OafA/YrhL